MTQERAFQDPIRCAHCGQPLPADETRHPDGTSCSARPGREAHRDPGVGRTIAGRYQLVRRIGRGGMGSVYDARHVATDHRFAVKLLDPLVARDPIVVARFRREAKSAATLKHRNCVEVFDYGQEDDGTFFLVMEFLDGVSLAEEVARVGPLSPLRVIHIGEQLLAALAHAHQQGVLHRDIKPQNVMLTQRFGWPDHVTVVDFGIARWHDPAATTEAALTLPGTVFGTPEFMSPEQARGEAMDARSDVFAAASVLWFLLLGRPPFRGDTARDTLSHVLHGAPPLPSRERPGEVPVELEGVLLRALEKDAARRYPSAVTLSALLGAFREVGASPSEGVESPLDDRMPALAGIPSAAASSQVSLPSPSSSTGAPPQVAAANHPDAAPRHPGVVRGVAGLLVAGVALGVAWSLWPVSTAPPPIDSAGSAADAVAPRSMPALETPVPAPADDLSRDPLSRGAHARAQAALRAGDLAGAQVAFAEVLAHDPRDARAHANLATLYFRQGLRDLARAHVSQAVALDPRYAAQLAPLLREAPTRGEGR